MANKDDGKRPKPAAWTYIRPRGGFSKGTRQGLWVCAVLLALLFVNVFLFGTPPETAQAVLADVVLGLLIAVAGVWVVGGMIELDSTLGDIGIKVGGGVAILLCATFYVRPIYFASGQSSHAESITLAPWATIAPIITEYEGQFSRREPNAIHLKVPDDIREKVLNFRAERPEYGTAYKANWGFPRRNPKLRILDQIQERQECLSFVEKDGKVVVMLIDTKLETQTHPEGKPTIYRCTVVVESG